MVPTHYKGMYEFIVGHGLRLLAHPAARVHTLFTYHRTWEIGLGAATRVTASNPSLFWDIFSSGAHILELKCYAEEAA